MNFIEVCSGAGGKSTVGKITREIVILSYLKT
jgi:hypothetical protein